jgi:oxepin-CoA hydrolase/3-oxo-5,6-dehydrosuberyl-CoA semialdehyde dehydrogenase
METLQSYLAGAWVAGTGRASTLVDPTTEEPLATASTAGLDLGKALAHARDTGGPALRALTFAQRGELLRAFSRVVHQNRDALIDLSIKNGGNTRSDAKFDIDGATGTLAFYADLGRDLGDQRFLVDGEGVQLGRSPRFCGQHVIVPRRGVAVHVNAFNFPAWGLAEKAACALLAGMPVVAKPATSTALVAFRIVQLVVEAGALPPGALSLVTGSPGDLLTHLGGQDVLAFTGSSDTGAAIRLLPNIAGRSVRVNVEADSLNAAVLGPDVQAGSDTYALFLKDVVRDMTQKAGQKCTAIRRVFVPLALQDQVRDDLADRLREAKVGDPAVEGVTVGPLATAQQLQDVRAGIARLSGEARLVVGGLGPFEKVGVPGDKGYFVPPTLLTHGSAAAARAVHEHEVFGPVATILPYADPAALGTEIERGQGSLVSSVYSDDRAFVGEMVFAVAPFNGRLMLGSEKIADQTPGPGTVLPQLVHGGPGRAGGGEELGGMRGLALYSQRTALQGARPVLDSILGIKR